MQSGSSLLFLQFIQVDGPRRISSSSSSDFSPDTDTDSDSDNSDSDSGTPPPPKAHPLWTVRKTVAAEGDESSTDTDTIYAVTSPSSATVASSTVDVPSTDGEGSDEGEVPDGNAGANPHPTPSVLLHADTGRPCPNTSLAPPDLFRTGMPDATVAGGEDGGCLGTLDRRGVDGPTVLCVRLHIPVCRACRNCANDLFVWRSHHNSPWAV